jgi:hypothetical protein
MAVVRFVIVFMGFGGAGALADKNVEVREGTAKESGPYIFTRPVFDLFSDGDDRNIRFEL